MTGQSCDASSPVIQQRLPALSEPPSTKYKCGDETGHRNVFNLLNYVRFHHLWRSQVRAAGNFNMDFPELMYEDICWTAIEIGVIARLQLTANTTMIQQHHGSDHLKEQFCGMVPRPKTQIRLLLVRDQRLLSPLLEAVKPMAILGSDSMYLSSVA